MAHPKDIESIVIKQSVSDLWLLIKELNYKSFFNSTVATIDNASDSEYTISITLDNLSLEQITVKPVTALDSLCFVEWSSEFTKDIDSEKRLAHKVMKVNALASLSSGVLSSDDVDVEINEGRDKSRLTTATAGKITEKSELMIGGDFKINPNPEFINKRIAIYDRIMEKQKANEADKPRKPIKITLPDGGVKEGISWETSPMDIAMGISKSLGKSVVVAKVLHTGERYGNTDSKIAASSMISEEDEIIEVTADGELWDLTRPLEGDCTLNLLKFDDPEGKMVFWHSSAHMLGECMECEYGVNLCIGPPVHNGFYYDAYMGKETLHPASYKDIEKKAKSIALQDQKFERIILTKDECLEMFADNPFKVELIKAKIADGSSTTAYRCGPLIDLCPGPHIPTTKKVNAFKVMKTSSSYWTGDNERDILQRVYGVSFPQPKELKAHLKALEEAEKYDHRRIGEKQHLFFFDSMSPGSCFFLPHGANIYNKLISFIRTEYRARGYSEVVTPNIFNFDLWHTSGHAQHYKKDMFVFNIEGTEFGLKPMNCPGHCLMFASRLRSWRELPIRLADFGVLHRNEASGALTGLTRVRRFQQDDAHIFCREDQIKEEVRGALEFVKHVYNVFGMTYKFELSTRPKKAMGDMALWDIAETQMEECLNEFVGASNWKLNPGDGAFYGPKIDIKITDIFARVHQTATIQLDFQQPINFKLEYKSGDDENFKRPVIIHRAMLGSVERSFAILTEHYKGKWPLWLSPRQIIIVPVSNTFADYAEKVRQVFWNEGFDVEVELSTKTLNKKIRESQLSQFNFIFVVGEKEMTDNTVNIRTRDNKVLGTKPLEETLSMMKEMIVKYE